MKKPSIEIVCIIIALMALLLFSMAVGDDGRAPGTSASPSTSSNAPGVP